MFNIACNASLQLAAAALAVAGFKADRQNHPYRVIQSLALTVDVGDELIDTLGKFRTKRHISDYERANVVSELESDKIQALAASLRVEVENGFGGSIPRC